MHGHGLMPHLHFETFVKDKRNTYKADGCDIRPKAVSKHWPRKAIKPKQPHNSVTIVPDIVAENLLIRNGRHHNPFSEAITRHNKLQYTFPTDLFIVIERRWTAWRKKKKRRRSHQLLC